jgi:hypothetical protein
MQAILWLKKPIHVSGNLFDILVADIEHHDPSDKSVVISLKDYFKLGTSYDHIVAHDNSVSDALWLVSIGGQLMPEVADVRFPV